MPYPLAYIERLGYKILEGIEGLGHFTSFMTKVFYWTTKKPFRTKLLMDQIHFIGNKSLFIVCLTAIFSGMVMAYQIYFGFQIMSGDALVGPIVALSMAKEIAPVFTGLVVSGRCAAAMAAQIGTMKVTEQLDALEVMGISSYQYLAVPRIIGATLALPLLSMIFLFVANCGSYYVGTVLLGIDEVLYFSKLHLFVFIEDIYQCFIKSFFFGFLIGSIGSYHGFSVHGGAEGVGKGTNLAVVWSMVIVLIVDYFLTSFLVQVL